MGLREFEDTEGRSWRVWDTLPEKTTGLVDDYRSGWLTFDDGTERLRLAPVPEGWTTLPAERVFRVIAVGRQPSQSWHAGIEVPGDGLGDDLFGQDAAIPVADGGEPGMVHAAAEECHHRLGGQS